MARLGKRSIIFGEGTNEVNSRSLPSFYTPTNYTPVQVGTEGSDKTSAHLKGIDNKLAGLVYSDGDLSETSFSAANNQPTPANITGLLFSNAVVRAFSVLASVYIDATSDKYESISILGIQKGSDWEMTITRIGDDSGIELSITTAGQIQYTSTNLAGHVATTVKFRASTTSV